MEVTTYGVEVDFFLYQLSSIKLILPIHGLWLLSSIVSSGNRGEISAFQSLALTASSPKVVVHSIRKCRNQRIWRNEHRACMGESGSRFPVLLQIRFEFYMQRSGHRKSVLPTSAGVCKPRTANMRADRCPRLRSGDRRDSKVGERKFNGAVCDLEPCAALHYYYELPECRPLPSCSYLTIFPANVHLRRLSTSVSEGHLIVLIGPAAGQWA
ncbi:hypothetical protein N431DRAFT_552494 [Stipitochalara longipes BDJ]|nr:hypothetical protein N431DRAFT_552494 [Stipitochalara longipes BDJ]